MPAPISFNHFPFPPIRVIILPLPSSNTSSLIPDVSVSVPTTSYASVPVSTIVKSPKPTSRPPNPYPETRTQILNAEVVKQIPVRITARKLNLKNVYSTGMFCNKQHNPENCIIIQNYKKTIDCLPKLMITNARSLLNKHDEAYSMTVANGVDLFAVTETWLHSQVRGEVISMPSFQLIRKDRINDHRGGGVCCYVKDYINCIHLTELENDDFEVLWVLLRPNRLPRGVKSDCP